MELVKELVYNFIHNGVIAKVTAAIVIIMVSLELTNSINYIESGNSMVLPILSGVLASAMTFLFVKKDGK